MAELSLKYEISTSRSDAPYLYEIIHKTTLIPVAYNEFYRQKIIKVTVCWDLDIVSVQ